ncbi:YdcF family protein [Clostridiaceae bacterium UIB06]|uniref:YdcF family protein n=1 Tax=Clostridium thailandense TaxID=2794346 RepID=A0A949TYR5_9CLOT|nr:YdcF family protein [Clostridium thailandense]MBV7272999.1 YdcF family protein [Clostridium thailandense]MCH5135663.1 YdcF family protein [Clostridiaceae bacterium UIB06]
MNKVFKFFKVILICGVIFILFSLCSVIYFGQNVRPQKSDCIIVLGCKVYGTTPSPFLTSRLEHAIELYEQGYGNYIIVSGGQGAGESISEAESMKRYLVSKGIKTNHIIAEDKSMTTMENLSNSKKLMERNNFKTALIVSNKYHLKRASLIALYCKINASYSGVFVKEYKSHEVAGYLREVPALIKFYLQYIYYKFF